MQKINKEIERFLFEEYYDSYERTHYPQYKNSYCKEHDEYRSQYVNSRYQIWKDAREHLIKMQGGNFYPVDMNSEMLIK